MLVVTAVVTVQELEDKGKVMEIIKTSAPISIDELKKYFENKETFYNIDYSTSRLKGQKLLTYLSNLDIPSDITVEPFTDEYFELLKEYFHSPFLVNVEFLEIAAIYVLLTYRKIVEVEPLVKFVDENKEIISKWAAVLDSCTLYNMKIFNVPEFTEFVEAHDIAVEDNKLEGINFVSLLKHEEFYSFYENVDRSNLKYYKSYFEDYMFKGKNLYSYWVNRNNPLFLLYYNIASGDYPAIREKAIKEAENVD